MENRAESLGEMLKTADNFERHWTVSKGGDDNILGAFSDYCTLRRSKKQADTLRYLQSKFKSDNLAKFLSDDKYCSMSGVPIEIDVRKDMLLHKKRVKKLVVAVFTDLIVRGAWT
jgi:hypothetical protein